MPDNNIYKANLDKIQMVIFQFLKPSGFKKKGRTFNRETEKGVIQVINLQSGPYISGSYYGKFTVNMGVLIEEIHNLNFPSKPFYSESYCQIRKRLPELSKGRDFWWDLSDSPEEIAKEIIKELDMFGLPWFNLFKTRELICQNLRSNGEKTASSSDKFYVAIITLQRDRKRGEELFQEYFDNLQNRKGHKDYIKALADRIGITLK